MTVELVSPVMGTVSDLRCEDGAEVEADEIVLTVESMKMNFEVRAPDDGIVHYVADLGEVVNKGQVVARIET